MNVWIQVPLSVVSLAASPLTLAYIGPGAGLSAIGSVLALVGTLLLMLVGFVWYPLKRFMRRKRAVSGAVKRSMDPNEQLAEAGDPKGRQNVDRR